MELTAALLHSPDVLFLDEPTIGLDVVAQHNIQKFLKHYQQERKITILLTSHYMKDVAALCKRVVIIAQGEIIYDGSLAGIVDRFSGHKVMTLQFADGRMPSDLARYGEVLEIGRAASPGCESTGRVSPRCWRPCWPTTRSRTSAWKTRRWKRSSPRCFRNRRSCKRNAAMPRGSGEKSSLAPPAVACRRIHRRELMFARAETWWTIFGSAWKSAGLSGRFRAGNADAVPADRDADFSVDGRVSAAAGESIRSRAYSSQRDRGLLPADDARRAFSSMPAWPPASPGRSAKGRSRSF